MIYTVTFNPALDYVVFLDNLKLGDVNRSTRESIFTVERELTYLRF